MIVYRICYLKRVLPDELNNLQLPHGLSLASDVNYHYYQGDTYFNVTPENHLEPTQLKESLRNTQFRFVCEVSGQVP